MKQSQNKSFKNEKEKNNYFPLSVPNYRFDQRNEMFKRRTWDEKFLMSGNQLYTQVKYKDKYGFRKLDYALRNASWNIEYDFAFGNMSSNRGLYSWNHVTEKVRKFILTDGPVINSLDDNTRILKKAARFFGADLVGICFAHPNLVYSHELDLLKNEHRPLEIPPNCNHAIIMAVEMDYETSRYSPDAISGASTGLGYTHQAILANLVATFIRGLGYQAIPSGNDTALSIPLAIAAGLGELGRNGLLITEKYGPRIRICKVFTDFPLEHDNIKTFGVTEFCRKCKKCAINCPSQSIPYGSQSKEGPSISNHSGVQKWYIDPEKCFMFWVKNWMDCNHCIKVCPFNKPKGVLHDVVRFVIRYFPFLNRLMVKLDGLFGYGKPILNQKKEFWESL